MTGLDRTPDEIILANRAWLSIWRISLVVWAVGYVVVGIALLGIATEPLRGVSR